MVVRQRRGRELSIGAPVAIFSINLCYWPTHHHLRGSSSVINIFVCRGKSSHSLLLSAYFMQCLLKKTLPSFLPPFCWRKIFGYMIKSLLSPWDGIYSHVIIISTWSAFGDQQKWHKFIPFFPGSASLTSVIPFRASGSGEFSQKSICYCAFKLSLRI